MLRGEGRELRENHHGVLWLPQTWETLLWILFLHESFKPPPLLCDVQGGRFGSPFSRGSGVFPWHVPRMFSNFHCFNQQIQEGNFPVCSDLYSAVLLLRETTLQQGQMAWEISGAGQPKMAD